MFPTYDQTRALVAERRNRYEASARRYRVRHIARLGRSTTPVAAIGAAARRNDPTLGRTPSDVGRAA